MPQDELILDDTRKSQLDKNIKSMLEGGASTEDVIAYASDFKTQFGQKKSPNQTVSKPISFGYSTPAEAISATSVPSKPLTLPSQLPIVEKAKVAKGTALISEQPISIVDKQLSKLPQQNRQKAYDAAVTKISARLTPMIDEYNNISQSIESGEVPEEEIPNLAAQAKELEPLIKQEQKKLEIMGKGYEAMAAVKSALTDQEKEDIKAEYEGVGGFIKEKADAVSAGIPAVVGMAFGALPFAIRGTAMSMATIPPALQKDVSDNIMRITGLSQLENASEELFKESSKISEKLSQKYDSGIIDSFEKGDISGAANQASSKFLESLIPSLAAASTGGIGALGFGAQEYYSGLKDRDDLTEQQKLGIASLNGALELAFESLGTKAVTGQVARLLKNEGKEAAEKSVKSFVEKALYDGFGKWTPLTAPAQEFISEYATSVSQSIVNKALDPAEDLTFSEINKQALEEGVVGAFGGEIIAAPTIPMMFKTKSAKDKAEELQSRTEKIDADLAKGVSDEVSAVLQGEKDKITQEVNKLIVSEKEVIDNLPAEAQTKISEISAQNDTLKQDLETVSEENRPIIEKQIEANNNQIESIINESKTPAAEKTVETTTDIQDTNTALPATSITTTEETIVPEPIEPKLKEGETQDAIQIESSGDISIQPEARVGEKVAEGVPESELKETAKQGKKGALKNLDAKTQEDFIALHLNGIRVKTKSFLDKVGNQITPQLRLSYLNNHKGKTINQIAKDLIDEGGVFENMDEQAVEEMVAQFMINNPAGARQYANRNIERKDDLQLRYDEEAAWAEAEANRLNNEEQDVFYSAAEDAMQAIDEMSDEEYDNLIKAFDNRTILEDELLNNIENGIEKTGPEQVEKVGTKTTRAESTAKTEKEVEFEARMTEAKEALKPALEKAEITYKQAIHTVNKYLREVKPDDVITEEELQSALKNKEEGKTREGYEPPTPPKKKVEEEEPKEKVSGRTKSYAEKRVPVSEEYRADVEKNKVSYQAMNMYKNADKAIEMLSEFGDTEEGLDKAYEHFLNVYDGNPFTNPANSVAIELLSDRLFAKATEAYVSGDVKTFEKLSARSNKLRMMAFNAATQAGQYNAALAVLARSSNPDAFLLFVNKEIEKANEIEGTGITDTLKKVKKENAQRETKQFQKKSKEIAEKAADEVSKNAPSPKRKVPNEKFITLKERGVKRQKDALEKLRKLGYLGSSGLNNEAIEAIGELVLAQLEIGIYKASVIAQKIKAMTDGKVTDENLREVLDNYKAEYEGKEYTLNELSEKLDKEYKKENAEKIALKQSEQAVKGRKSLSELVKMQLSENADVEVMTKSIMNEFDLSEQAARALATKYVNNYKRVLTERINKQLIKDLGIKNVKEIEQKENSGEIKPYEKTLGGKIVAEIMSGAFDSGTSVSDAFAQKYGFPVLTPTMQNNIRLLASRANSAKTALGQKVANRALITYLQSILPTNTWGALNTLYYVSMLSGVTTAAVNTWGNFNVIVNQSVENFAQSIMEAVKGDTSNLASTINAKQKVKRAIASFNNATTTFLDIMAKGGGESKYYNLNQKALDSYDSESLVIKKEDLKDLGIKRLLKAFGKAYYSIPAIINRNLPAADDAFSALNFNMEASREVRKSLAKSGLKGKELETAVAQQVYGTPELQTSARLEAIAEVKRIGLDPKNEKRLIKRLTNEIIQNNLDTKIQDVAREVAAENTYRGKHRGLVGLVGSKIPQMVLITPFVNTASKISEFAVNYFPVYGLIRASGYGITDAIRRSSPTADKYFSRSGVDYGQRSGELRQKQIAKVALANSFYLTVWALSKIMWHDPEDDKDKPLIEASGSYLGVPYAKRDQLEKIMPAYTLRIGPVKINYLQNPMWANAGLLLSVNDDLARAGKEELAFTDPEMYFKIIKTIAIYIINANPVKNLQEFFKATSKLSDASTDVEIEDIIKDATKSAALAPSTIAFPNTYKQGFDFYNPTKYQLNDYKDAFWKAMNMENIGELQPDYDWWGRPVKAYPGESTYPLRDVFGKTTDPVDEWAIDKDISIPNLNRKTLVLDLSNNRSYTKKAWDKKVANNEAKEVFAEADEIVEVDANYKLLTQSEWADMDKTVRRNVHSIIGQNLSKVTDSEMFDEPINTLTKKQADKIVDQLFKQERMKYIHEHFKTEEE